MWCLSFPIHEKKIIWIFVKYSHACKIVLLLLEFGIPQLANMHLFCLAFFFFHAVLSRHLPLITYLWDSFSRGAWLAPIFPSSSLPKQDRFLLHYFFVLCGICNTLPALYHLWIPFLLVVFSLSLQHLEWRSLLCCCCCNWTWYLKGKGWNKLLWWFIPGAERFAPLISVPWSELCYVISVCLGRLNSWHIWAGGIPDTRASDWKRSTLHSSPTLRYVKESVRFDAPGPIRPLRQPLSAFNATEKPVTFLHLPKSITCSLCILYPCRGVPTQFPLPPALFCGQISLPAHPLLVCHMLTRYWGPFHHSFMWLCTDLLVMKQDEWKPWKEHGKPSLSLAYPKYLGHKPNIKGLDEWDGFPGVTAELEEGPWRPTVLQTGLKWEFFGRFA